jgi:hypothetical protein
MSRTYHRTIGRAVAAAVASLSLFVLAVPAAHAAAATPSLGSAVNFAAVAATTITNTGNTVVTGDLGVSPGTAVTGFPPGIVNGTIYTTTPGPAATAAADAETAFNNADQPCDFTRSDPDLGGDTLPPACTASPATRWA